MAHTDRYGNKQGQFPIHYKKDGFVVYTNPSGELFVAQVRPDGSHGVTMRFGHTSAGLRFTTDARVEPEIVGNMIGWRVQR